MQTYYKNHCDKYGLLDQNHFHCKGVSLHYEKIDRKTKKLSSETGIVLLSLPNCGAGIICHEFGHAVLWAKGHKKYKKQYPIIIKNMNQEEEILHNLTFSVSQFYSWYWKVQKTLKNEGSK